MTGFTQVFGGSNIYPVQPSYSTLNYASNVQLQWPIEQAPAGALVVTSIMDLNPSAGSLTVSLPDARQVSTGYVALFNNISGQTTSVLSNTGATILSLVSGTVWQIYLVDNTTAGGTWRIFQFGASVSVAVAAALAGAGLIPLGSTLNENMVVQPKNASYVTVATDRATIVQWTAGVGTFTLLAPGTATAGWFVWFKNQGSGNLTVSPTSGTIDGNASDTLAPGASAIYFTDGSNFFSLKGGGTAGGGSGFNLLQIDVSGSGNFALSGAQLNQIGYRFVGTLTGARHIIVPNTAQEYWVDNETTGAFTLDVGTAAQVSPIVVPQANRNILYCDGTNVINANTSTVVFPITISQGGTSATTAPVALTNLGGTTVGVNVFTAASAAAAAAAISAVQTSRNINTGNGLQGGGSLAADLTLSLNFKGATVYNNADQFPGTAGATLAWNTHLTDIGGWHSDVTNNSRLTVPAGVAVVEIIGVLRWGSNLQTDTFVINFTLRKNGAIYLPAVGTWFDCRPSQNNSSAFNDYMTTFSSGPISVATNDYFEVFAAISNISGVNTGTLRASSLFSIKALG